jgi:acyl-CoA thioesterase
VRDFEQATAVESSGGGHSATIDGDWCAWSPAGGYLMALALRAASGHAAFAKPLSLSCHFLSAPKLGEVQLSVSSLRRARVAESLRISMLQDEKPVLEMLLWCGDRIEGYVHTDAAMPEVPEHGALGAHEYQAGLPGFQTVWQNLEHRPCGPLHWEREQAGAPRQRDWIRLLGFKPGADAFMEAGRYALLLDSFTWPAAAQAHAGDPRFVAPTISLSIDFHQWTEREWLLSDAHAPYASAGVIAIHNRLWSSEGEHLATAHGTLICRPRP